jgi:hypothetical protein
VAARVRLLLFLLRENARLRGSIACIVSEMGNARNLRLIRPLDVFDNLPCAWRELYRSSLNALHAIPDFGASAICKNEKTPYHKIEF